MGTSARGWVAQLLLVNGTVGVCSILIATHGFSKSHLLAPYIPLWCQVAAFICALVYFAGGQVAVAGTNRKFVARVLVLMTMVKVAAAALWVYKVSAAVLAGRAASAEPCDCNITRWYLTIRESLPAVTGFVVAFHGPFNAAMALLSIVALVKMSGGKAASPDDEDAVGESDEDDGGDSHQDGTDGESNDGMGELPSAETPSPTKLTPRRSARLSARKSGSRASDSSARRVSSRRSSRRKAAAGNLSESDVDGAASFN